MNLDRLSSFALISIYGAYIYYSVTVFGGDADWLVHCVKDAVYFYEVTSSDVTKIRCIYWL